MKLLNLLFFLQAKLHRFSSPTDYTNYFLVLSTAGAAAAAVSTVAAAVSTVAAAVSTVVAVESAAASLFSPAQDANTPNANTNNNFFIFFLF
jgi:hypothetical protein